jgi:hypothetical protein
MSNGQADFFRNMLPYARRVSELTGIDPRLVLAQSALETGYGRSAPNFNFFGIKAPQGQGASLMTSEFENGQMVSRNEPFRTYESPAGSFQDYANLMLRAPRYRPVLEARTLEDQIAAMAASGYATDPEYGSKLSQIASGINLDDPGLIASDAMTAIGRGPDVSGMTATARPRPAMNGQPTTPGLLAQGVAPERPRRDIGNILDQLAVGFAGMSLRPNQGIVQMAQQRIGQRQEQQQTERERNATLEWLSQSGLPNAELLIGGVRAGAITPADAARTGFQLLKTQSEAASDPNVQSSTTLPDMSGVVTVMRDGSVRVTTAGGETLSGQAAQDFVSQAQANAAQVARELYGARREGTLGADIELGGTAAATTAAGEAQIERANEAFDQAANVQSNISNINDAIAAIDAGARSGLVENFFPSITEASASLENAMNRMGLDVIGSVTFGALSEGEMRLAMETAVPRNLDPAQLRDYLVRKREAQTKARDALMRAANYLSRPGNTLEGWFAQRQQEMTDQTTGSPSGSTRMRFDAEGNLIND